MSRHKFLLNMCGQFCIYTISFFFLPRITPPFHTSSPEHERYTPPSERRRGQLFDEEGFLPKNVVGPRNLLEVHVFVEQLF